MHDIPQLDVITILLRISLAVIVGGILGIERGNKNQAAGFRTYILVCVGAAMVMLTNQYIAQTYQVGDPSRMGAQVISGVGFLGAGTILTTEKNRIRGLTTAAGLWAAATIGLAIGIGFYAGAIIVAVALLLVLTFFQTIKQKIQNRSRIREYYVLLASLEAYNRLLIYCSSQQIQILDVRNGLGDVDIINSTFLESQGDVGCVFSLKLTEHDDHLKVLEAISQLAGVKYVEEVK